MDALRLTDAWIHDAVVCESCLRADWPMGNGTLGRLVHDPAVYIRLDSAAKRLDSASARLGEILDDFKENPGRYLGTMKLIDIF